jgi:hypothetical protein
LRLHEKAPATLSTGRGAGTGSMRNTPSAGLLAVIVSGPAEEGNGPNNAVVSKSDGPLKATGLRKSTNYPSTLTTPAAVSGLKLLLVYTKPIFGVGPTGKVPESASQ